MGSNAFELKGSIVIEDAGAAATLQRIDEAQKAVATGTEQMATTMNTSLSSTAAAFSENAAATAAAIEKQAALASSTQGAAQASSNLAQAQAGLAASTQGVASTSTGALTGVAALETELGNLGAQIALAEMKGKDYANAVKSAAVATDFYQTVQSKLSGTLGETSPRMQQLAKDLEKSRGELNNAVKAQEDYRNSLNAQRADYSALSSAIRNTDTTTGAFEGTTNRLKGGMDRLTYQIRTQGTIFQGYDQVLQGLAGAMGGITVKTAILISVLGTLAGAMFRTNKEQKDLTGSMLGLLELNDRLVQGYDNVTGSMHNMEMVSGTLRGEFSKMQELDLVRTFQGYNVAFKDYVSATEETIRKSQEFDASQRALREEMDSLKNKMAEVSKEGSVNAFALRGLSESMQHLGQAEMVEQIAVGNNIEKRAQLSKVLNEAIKIGEDLIKQGSYTADSLLAQARAAGIAGDQYQYLAKALHTAESGYYALDKAIAALRPPKTDATVTIEGITKQMHSEYVNFANDVDRANFGIIQSMNDVTVAHTKNAEALRKQIAENIKYQKANEGVTVDSQKAYKLAGDEMRKLGAAAGDTTGYYNRMVDATDHLNESHKKGGAGARQYKKDMDTLNPSLLESAMRTRDLAKVVADLAITSARAYGAVRDDVGNILEDIGRNFVTRFLTVMEGAKPSQTVVDQYMDVVRKQVGPASEEMAKIRDKIDKALTGTTAGQAIGFTSEDDQIRQAGMKAMMQEIGLTNQMLQVLERLGVKNKEIGATYKELNDLISKYGDAVKDAVDKIRKATEQESADDRAFTEKMFGMYREGIITFEQLAGALRTGVIPALHVTAQTLGELGPAGKAAAKDMNETVRSWEQMVEDATKHIGDMITENVSVKAQQSALRLRDELRRVYETSVAYAIEVEGKTEEEAVKTATANVSRMAEELLREMTEKANLVTDSVQKKFLLDMIEQFRQAWAKMPADFAAEMNKLPPVWERIVNELLRITGNWNTKTITAIKGGLKDLFDLIEAMPGDMGDALRKSTRSITEWINFIDLAIKQIQKILGAEQTGIAGVIRDVIGIFKKSSQTVSDTAAQEAQEVLDILKQQTADMGEIIGDDWGVIFDDASDTVGGGMDKVGQTIQQKGQGLLDLLSSMVTGMAMILGGRAQGGLAGGLTSAMGGFMIGAKIGSFFGPGLGTIIGGAIGAIGGFFAGLFGGGKSEAQKTIEKEQAEQAKIQTELMKQSLEKAYQDTFQAALDTMSKAADLLQKLDDFTPVHEKIIKRFFNHLELLVKYFCELANQFQATNWETVKAMAEALSPMIDAASMAADMFDKLITFIEPGEEKIKLFGVELGYLLNMFIDISDDFEVSLMKQARKFATRLYDIVAVVSGGADAFTKIKDVVNVPKDNINLLIASIEYAVQLMIEADAELDRGGVKAASRLAVRANDVVSLIANAIDPFIKIRDLADVPEANIKILIHAIRVTMDEFMEAMNDIAADVLAAQSGKATSGAGVISIINSAIEPFTKIKDLKEIPKDNLRMLIVAIRDAVIMFNDEFADLSSELIDAVSKRASLTQAVGDAIGVWADALVKVAQIQAFDYNLIIAAVEGARLGVKTFIEQTADIDQSLLAQAATTATNMKSIFDVVAQVADILKGQADSKAATIQSLVDLVNGYKLVLLQIHYIEVEVGPEMVTEAVQFSSQMKIVLDILNQALDFFNRLADFRGISVETKANLSTVFDTVVSVLEEQLEKALHAQDIATKIKEAMTATADAVGFAAALAVGIAGTHAETTASPVVSSVTNYNIGTINFATNLGDIQSFRDLVAKVDALVARDQKLAAEALLLGGGR